MREIERWMILEGFKGRREREKRKKNPTVSLTVKKGIKDGKTHGPQTNFL